MAFKLIKNPLLNLKSNQLIRISSKLISNDISKDISIDKVEPVEHKEVVYQDGPVKVIEKKTHTKQMWDKDDFRLVRYIGKEKQINENFAIDLIADEPIIKSKERTVYCDGGNGPLGHPRIYINLDQSNTPHSCGYCGLRYQLIDNHH